MAILFDVTPSLSQRFVSPSVSITATDTTPAVSALSSWEWFFNGTSVSTASSWSYTFFDPITSMLSLNGSNSAGTFSSSSSTVIILPAWPTYISFIVEPSNNVEFITGLTRAVSITATDSSPASYGISSWQWSFNNVNVSTASSWSYTFFEPITGSLALTLQGQSFSGSIVIGPSAIQVTAPTNLNACLTNVTILPEGRRGSTTLNHNVTSYELLSDRIKYQLGWPVTQVEMCDDQIFSYIDQAIEWYSKYAGYTEEYMVFDACRTYKYGYGLKMDDIINRLYAWHNSCNCQEGRTDQSLITAQYIDCDLNNYRKVIDVFSLDPVEFTGTDVLFTMDYLFAQQTYFSYMLGSFGFDLITWHILKDWLNLREKMFATKPYIRFDNRTQLLRLMPEPTPNNNFYGVIGCRVEKPIAHLVQERWVQRYALALTMIALAHIRGKFGAVTLFGGASLNASDMMTQGLEMKKELEDELMNKYGEVEPPFFFVG